MGVRVRAHLVEEQLAQAGYREIQRRYGGDLGEIQGSSGTSLSSSSPSRACARAGSRSAAHLARARVRVEG